MPVDSYQSITRREMAGFRDIDSRLHRVKSLQHHRLTRQKSMS